MTAILVTGGSGQLAAALQRCAWPEDYGIVAIDVAELDLTDTAAVAAKAAEHPWTAVINGAANAAVDKGESDLVTAWAVNAVAPAAFGEACAKAGIPLPQNSTDYVFASDKAGAWEVTDPAAPLDVYGASKFGGELAARTSGARHVIVRTAWVVSAHGNNFVKTMLRVRADHDTRTVVDDQRGSPTSPADFAAALMTIAVRLIVDDSAPTGTYHFSDAGETSWAGFAAEIFRQSGARGGATANAAPITTDQYPTPAQRPANSLLSHAAIRATYGIEPRAWQDALGDILDELIGADK